MALSDGLLSWFEGDEASATDDLADRLGNAVGAQVNAPGANGTYRSFNVFEYFQLDTNFGIGAAGQAFSVAFKGYRSNFNCGFLGAQSAAGANVFQIDYFSRLRCVYGVSPYDTLQAPSGQPLANTEFYAAFTFTAAGLGTLYLDAISVATDAAPTGAFGGIPSLHVASISMNGAPNSRLSGRMSKIGFWSRALDGSEVTELATGWSYVPPTVPPPAVGGLRIGLGIGF